MTILKKAFGLLKSMLRKRRIEEVSQEVGVEQYSYIIDKGLYTDLWKQAKKYVTTNVNQTL